MKKITTKYGTVINVKGLTPEQVDKVKSIAETGGSYGGKATALAQELQKKNKKGGKGGKTPDDTMTPGTGVVNAGIDPETGAIVPDELLTAAANNWNDERAKMLRDEARQSAYDFATANYDKLRTRDLEDARQRAAERGLPYDPGNPESAYGKEVGAVTDQYSAMYQQAADAAVAQGNQVYQTETAANTNAFDSFIKAALGMSSAELSKYGIDKDAAVKLKQIAAQKQIAAADRAARGGGGGSAGGGVADTSPIISGAAPGFNV